MNVFGFGFFVRWALLKWALVPVVSVQPRLDLRQECPSHFRKTLPMRYAHTNIVTKDWERLVQFYCDVFSCIPVPPERKQSGDWLDLGTGVTNAELQGMHLRLPGYGENGPTLEVYQYTDIASNTTATANRQGLGHLAFEVDDVQATKSSILDHGGSLIGKVSETQVEGVGNLTFVYMADPDGNLLELQNWNDQ